MLLGVDCPRPSLPSVSLSTAWLHCHAHLAPWLDALLSWRSFKPLGLRRWRRPQPEPLGSRSAMWLPTAAKIPRRDRAPTMRENRMAAGLDSRPDVEYPQNKLNCLDGDLSCLVAWSGSPRVTLTKPYLYIFLAYQTSDKILQVCKKNSLSKAKTFKTGYRNQNTKRNIQYRRPKTCIYISIDYISVP